MGLPNWTNSECLTNSGNPAYISASGSPADSTAAAASGGPTQIRISDELQVQGEGAGAEAPRGSQHGLTRGTTTQRLPLNTWDTAWHTASQRDQLAGFLSISQEQTGYIRELSLQFAKKTIPEGHDDSRKEIMLSRVDGRSSYDIEAHFTMMGLWVTNVHIHNPKNQDSDPFAFVEFETALEAWAACCRTFDVAVSHGCFSCTEISESAADTRLKEMQKQKVMLRSTTRGPALLLSYAPTQLRLADYHIIRKCQPDWTAGDVEMLKGPGADHYDLYWKPSLAKISFANPPKKLAKKQAWLQRCSN